MDPMTEMIIMGVVSAVGNSIGGDNDSTQTTTKQLDPPSATENYLLGQLMKPYVGADQWQDMYGNTGGSSGTGISGDAVITREKLSGHDCILIAGREPYGPDDVITDQADEAHYL